MSIMASNDSQRQLITDKRAHRENHTEHLATISKSIGKIVKNSSNDEFKSDVCNALNVKMGRRKKTIQTQTLKLMKSNYSQPANQSSEQRNSSKGPTSTNSKGKEEEEEDDEGRQQ